MLEQIDGVTEMHGAYYRVAAEYQKVEGGGGNHPDAKMAMAWMVGYKRSLQRHGCSTPVTLASFTSTRCASWGASTWSSCLVKLAVQSVAVGMLRCSCLTGLLKLVVVTSACVCSGSAGAACV